MSVLDMMSKKVPASNAQKKAPLAKMPMVPLANMMPLATDAKAKKSSPAPAKPRTVRGSTAQPARNKVQTATPGLQSNNNLHTNGVQGSLRPVQGRYGASRRLQ